MSFIAKLRLAGKAGRLDEAHLQRLIAHAPFAMAAIDGEGHTLAANAACKAVLGRSEEELYTGGIFAGLHPRDAPVLRERLRELLAVETESVRVRQRWLRWGRETVWCQVTGYCVAVGSQQQSVVVLSLEDVTAQVRLEEEHRDREAELALQRAAGAALAAATSADSLLESLLGALCAAGEWAVGLLWTPDAGDGVLSCTRWHTTSAETQLFVAAIRQRSLTPGSDPAVRAWTERKALWIADLGTTNRTLHVAKAQDAGLGAAVLVPLVLPGDTLAVIELLSREPREERVALLAALSEVAVMTERAIERIEADAPVRAREARFRSIAEAAGEAIISIDGESTIEFANAAAERIFGYTREEMLGQSLTMLMPPGMRPAHEAGMKRFVETERRRIQWEGIEFPGLHKSGKEILLQMSLADVGEGDRRVFTGFIRDVTEQKREESALVYQALHDALTDLPNRNLLQERLTRAVLVGHRHNSPLALLFMDLDRFKDVNDTFGHHCGDQLLQQVAERLRRTLRESDTVARLGGDEFAVLLPATDERGAQLTARRLLDAFREPYTMEGQSFDVGASIGIAYYPQHGGDAATLMRRADVAMYAAKRNASGFAVYSADRDEVSSFRLLLTGELRHAIDHNQLLLHYQPKVNLIDGKTENVEALIRWQHPKRGLQSPDGFIPLAEETGLVKPLTVWVLNEALRQHREWRSEGLDLRVAVNFSARVLHDPDLMSIVMGALHDWQVEPSNLEVEITESAIMVDPERARATLTALHEAGIMTSIDDFGTGHSSLAYLRHLPFDEIKIDKSFVLDMATSRDDASIVAAVVALGHNFDLQVVAEGVDNQRTLDMLGKMGCDLAQGFFLSRPVAAEDLSDWLRDPKRRLSVVAS